MYRVLCKQKDRALGDSEGTMPEPCRIGGEGIHQSEALKGGVFKEQETSSSEERHGVVDAAPASKKFLIYSSWSSG